MDPAHEEYSRGMTAYKAGDLKTAAGHFERVLEIDPGHGTASVNLGVLQCEFGDFEEGLARLSAHVRLHPEDANARNNLWRAADAAISRYSQRGELAKGVGPCRELIALDPDNAGLRVMLHTFLHVAGERAQLSDFTPDLTPDALGRTLFIACMPKSGSTWLHSVLLALTGFANAYQTYAYLQNEQELYLPQVIRHARDDLVVQQHCRATAANVAIMQAFEFTPIVLVRNLFDTLVSMRDFYDSGAHMNSFLYPHYLTLPEEERLDAVIDTLASWYVQFYASWDIAERKGQLPVKWISYEEMMSDKTGSIAALCALAGIDGTEGRIAAAIGQVDGARERTRFNKGIAGRGEEILSAGQKGRIRALARHFPETDFTRLGL